MTFAEEVTARLPDGLHLPEAFAATFGWAEAQGFAVTHDRPMDDPFRQRSLLIYPPSLRDAPGASYVAFSFEPGPPLHAPPPEVVRRIVTLAVIAGDGGTLSLWLDDSGTQWIVVFDHGIPFVLTDDPLVALQFLAIGYPEPAAIGDATRTAAEIAARDGWEPPLPPAAFRAFLTDRFGVKTPDRASDLGITIPPGDAPDPIRDWLDVHMPEPDALPLPGSSPDHPFIITRDLRDLLDDQTLQGLRDAYDYVVEEE